MPDLIHSHQIVPTLSPGQQFSPTGAHPLDYLLRAHIAISHLPPDEMGLMPPALEVAGQSVPKTEVSETGADPIADGVLKDPG
jgi:hypothetical protein